MNWRIERANQPPSISFRYNDPGGALDRWRTVKLERGFLRHPSASVRIAACRELLYAGYAQDECWDSLSETERSHIKDNGGSCCTAQDIAAERDTLQHRDASWWWPRYTDRETRRLLTAANNRKLRTDICSLYQRDYPGDLDTGCPADQPPPATIVTDRGDIPLIGPWPR